MFGKMVDSFVGEIVVIYDFIKGCWVNVFVWVDFYIF